MNSFMNSETPPKKTSLVIDFVIVGGGLAGLGCAIALRRVGHRVQVLEADSGLNMQTSGGIRMPPNMSKILYHWGLHEQVQQIAFKSQAIDLQLFEKDELLGTHIWDEEMLQETRGEFVMARYCDLRKLLYDTAVALGAKILFNSHVKTIDPDARTVTLASGRVFHADVIVGADGSLGKTREIMEAETPQPHQLVMYSSTVPKKAVLQDKELRPLYDRTHRAMYAWFGYGRAVLAFPTGGDRDLGLYVYGPADGNEGQWEQPAPIEGMRRILETAEPRLRKLGALAKPPICVPVTDFPDLEDWVHDSGRMVIIGEAAHPMPPGAIQTIAMAVEDGAVLAKLFSHLRAEDQISNFLYAFEDLRHPRCTAVLKKEFGDIFFMTLPPGEMQEGRDAHFRAKRDAGESVLAGGEGETVEEWSEMKDIFGYDAEDEADDWWQEWGVLKEHAIGREIVESGASISSIVVQHQATSTGSIKKQQSTTRTKFSGGQPRLQF
ncbi:putative FAD binding domain containing protein [Lyophyllum shimeji]|uniref:FAD binding domain containing protein n=1 Tax=Lyophyllum shimeji TaxID=47721 RepID=A0A9P3UU26_LYOSH|nr:putative FAD binding domain containing protein [Lyophyllum shimeji]